VIRLPHQNLAIEALKKLINGDVRSNERRNVVPSKAFSERLEAVIFRYHANAITTAQVLEELIRLAIDIRATRARGEESGLATRRAPSMIRLPRTTARDRPWRAGSAGDRARARQER
jgi:type I site-specific restriction-modification system R (restriction) subunit